MIYKEKFLSDKAFKEELERCESCIEKPCSQACPVGCSPTDFIRAAKGMNPSDFIRAGAMILKQNPLGGICGKICSEKHCVSACSLNKTFNPVDIPAIQAEIVKRAHEFGVDKAFSHNTQGNLQFAVVGAGPSGLAAAATLSQEGYKTTIFEEKSQAGGLCCLIPTLRLKQKVIESDVEFIQSLGVSIQFGESIPSFETLLESYDGVVVANGRWLDVNGNFPGKNYVVTALHYLTDDRKHYHSPAIIGCGGIAVDCAIKALEAGADKVDIFALETLSELNLSQKEKELLFSNGIELHPRHGVKAVEADNKGGYLLELEEMALLEGKTFSPADMRPLPNSSYKIGGFDAVILAIGLKGDISVSDNRIVFAGECRIGASTAVESVASGKGAALELLEILKISSHPSSKIKTERQALKGYRSCPVDLSTNIFGYNVESPFLLSASPVSDGYERIKKAYSMGWSGCILKTGFDGIPVHTPGEYMYCQSKLSYANCDSVSERDITELCKDVERLRKEFPHHLTMVSTGTEMTGNDEIDFQRWTKSTKMLEAAGAMGIEYSLSIPGADGIDSLAVNQDIEKTLKIAHWILSTGDKNVPKIFKLTASVPAITPFINGLKKVADEFPGCKIGVTIGDTLPNLVFQNRTQKPWENGVIMGVGGKGISAINSFSIAKSVGKGIPINASGGIVSYMDAAHYLAMGAEFVQLCSMVMRYGYSIIDELKSGVSWLMHERGIKNMKELIGIASPDIVLPFDNITTVKKIPHVNKNLCASCGNCQSCPALAVSLDGEGFPIFDADLCIGCSFCTQICFTGALCMTARKE